VIDKIHTALDGDTSAFKPARPEMRKQKTMMEFETKDFVKASEEIAEAIPLAPLAVKFGVLALGLVIRLVVYSLLITPAALTFVYSYFFDRRIIRRVRFGPNRRNYLDIYLPDGAKQAREGSVEPLPVVVGIMGGAWVMGHRSWNTQLGVRLLDAGIILVAVDYRNYPIGKIPEMVEDISRALNWVHANIAVYGGDPQNVVVHAQSAGAHLTALLMLERSLMEAHGEETPRAAMPLSDVKACILLSGPYDLEALQPHVISRGLNAGMLHSLCVDGDLAGCSPYVLLDTPEWAEAGLVAAESLPPIHLFHGTEDQAVPSWSSVRFAKKLKDVGVKNVTLDIRPGFTHTLPILEGPMRGECDMQVELILPYLFGKDAAQQRLAALPKQPRLLPEFMLRAAMYVTPY